MVTKIPKFRRFVLQNFPFIEQDFDALTDYGLICKVVEYLNKVIEQSNETSEQVELLTNAFNELKDYVDKYFDDLNLQEEVNNKLEVMAEDGTLANIINQEIFGELNDKVDAQGTKIDENRTESLDLIAENYTHSLELSSFVNEIVDLPLLLTKRNDGTANGAAQGIACKFDTNGMPNTIFQWVDYGTYAKLYITSCGSRTDGTGWNTRVLSSSLNQIPYAHGSTLSYKDNTIIVGELGSTSIAVIDYMDESYTTVNLSAVVPQSIVSCVWDEITQTYNVLLADNVTHYILDENYAEVRHYAYQANGLDFTSYSFQGYDYFNGYEYRTLSGGAAGNATNICAVVDTTSGKIAKIIKLENIVGEVEDITVHNNIALFSYNQPDAYCDLIWHHYVTEGYIGGYPEANFKILQDYSPVLHGTDYKMKITAEGINSMSLNIIFENKYSDNEIVRYIGDGSEANPIKSGSALGTVIATLNKICNDVTLHVKFKASTNTDDTGLHMPLTLANYNVLDIDCFAYNGNMTHLWIINSNARHIQLRQINITTNTSRRDNKLTLAGNTGLTSFYNNNTVPAFDNSYLGFVRFSGGGLRATANSSFIGSMFLMTSATFASQCTTTGTLTANTNIFVQ